MGAALDRCALRSTLTSPIQDAGPVTDGGSCSNEIALIMRQQPKEALIAQDGKERGTFIVGSVTQTEELTWILQRVSRLTLHRSSSFTSARALIPHSKLAHIKSNSVV